MKSANRVLLIFGISILVLVVVAVVVVLALPARPAQLLPEGTPQGTVQRYVLALENRDYSTAYGYLAPPPEMKQNFDQWRSNVMISAEAPARNITLGQSNINGDQASVEIIIDVFRTTGPLNNPVSTNLVTFFLKNTGGTWVITAPLDIWWMQY